MDKKIEEVLKNIGLDKKEIDIYLSLLKIGEITATRISQETFIERTLVYYILDKLMEKGLVTYKLKNNVKYYSAADPENIVDNLKEKLEECRAILPELKAIKNKSYEEEPKVDIYKGFEGLKAVMRDLFKETKEILIFGEQGQFAENYPEYGYVYLHLLKKHNVSEKVIARDDFIGKVLGWKKSEFRYVPKKFLSPTTTVIYQDKIIITIWEKPTYNILIKSKKISDSYRSYFMNIWKTAKRG